MQLLLAPVRWFGRKLKNNLRFENDIWKRIFFNVSAFLHYFLQHFTHKNMKLITDSESYSKYKNQFTSFKDLYIKGFPDINEREDFDVILNRVFGPKQTNEPHSVIILSISEDDNPEVMGGLIADWYEKSQAIHLIYLIIDEKFRGKGVAKKLINNGVADIKNWIKAEKGIEIKNVFFESNNPLKTNLGNDSFYPVKRLEIFSHLGAKLININYIQPALDKKKKEVDNLLLLSFPQFNANGDKIPATEIAHFLKDLYISLGETENSKSFKNMVSNLERIQDKNGDVGLEPLVETPAYRFIKSSVTFHFIEIEDIQLDYKNVPGSRCPCFSSFEADLFNHQNQKKPPFKTVFKEFIRDAMVVLPAVYNYTSEGQSRTKLTYSNRTELQINLSVSRSVFEKSGKKIYHITLAPASENYFTELDLIKLSTLFGSNQEDSSIKSSIKFKLGGGISELSPSDLIQTFYPETKKSRFENSNNGIVQIELNEFVSPEKIEFTQFFDIFQKDEKHRLTNEIRDFSKMVCGMVLGIFDFNRMGNDEIFDTILPIVSNNLSFMVMCRGAVLKISVADDFTDSITKNIIVSPYMLIANSVLVHNEYILFGLKQKIDKILVQISHPKLQDLEMCLTEARIVLNYQYLLNIFQYPGEQKIIESGNSQKGINHLNSIILSRVNELFELIEITKTKKSKLPEALMNALLTFIAAIQLKGLFGEMLKESYSDSSIYIISFVFSVAAACVVFLLVLLKKK